MTWRTELPARGEGPTVGVYAILFLNGAIYVGESEDIEKRIGGLRRKHGSSVNAGHRLLILGGGRWRIERAMPGATKGARLQAEEVVMNEYRQQGMAVISHAASQNGRTLNQHPNTRGRDPKEHMRASARGAAIANAKRRAKRNNKSAQTDFSEVT